MAMHLGVVLINLLVKCLVRAVLMKALTYYIVLFLLKCEANSDISRLKIIGGSLIYS